MPSKGSRDDVGAIPVSLSAPPASKMAFKKADQKSGSTSFMMASKMADTTKSKLTFGDFSSDATKPVVKRKTVSLRTPPQSEDEKMKPSNTQQLKQIQKRLQLADSSSEEEVTVTSSRQKKQNKERALVMG